MENSVGEFIKTDRTGTVSINSFFFLSILHAGALCAVCNYSYKTTLDRPDGCLRMKSTCVKINPLYYILCQTVSLCCRIVSVT